MDNVAIRGFGRGISVILVPNGPKQIQINDDFRHLLEDKPHPSGPRAGKKPCDVVFNDLAKMRYIYIYPGQHDEKPTDHTPFGI